MVAMTEQPSLWHYLGSFIFYTLAAIAMLYVAYLYLKRNPNGMLLFAQKSPHSKHGLSIESRLGLEPRKNLYVVRSGQERFLIATSGEGTQFLSRLETEAVPETETQPEATHTAPGSRPDVSPATDAVVDATVLARPVDTSLASTVTSMFKLSARCLSRLFLELPPRWLPTRPQS